MRFVSAWQKNIDFFSLNRGNHLVNVGHAVAQLVEALR